MTSPGQVRSFDLSVYYLIAYSTVGVTLPFFPQFLKSLGLTGTQIGLVLSVGPLMALLAPPFWGHLADRTGQPGRVLFMISSGACLSFSAFLWATQFATILAVALAYGVFNSAISTIVDSITLNHVKKLSGSYSRIRVMGSVGFAAMSRRLQNRLSDATPVPMPRTQRVQGKTFVERVRKAQQLRAQGEVVCL